MKQRIACDKDGQIINAMSVDVEEYFQVSAFENHINRSDWGRLPGRAEASVDQILTLFSDQSIKATFFTLGWMAERYPQMVRRIVDEGHELASHGWSHIRVSGQKPDEFRSDVIRTRATLEDLSGQQIKGYRAASYSIGAKNLWALDILEETGHIYSSSIFPIKHDHYGMPEAPRFAFHPNGGNLLEVPVTTVEVMGRKIPCGGGGWFRFFPYAFSHWAIKHVNETEGQSAIFYFHPWEIDFNQPRQQGLPYKTRFRHYLNLRQMEQRLTRLLQDFHWSSMDEVFLGTEE
ncbi:MAG: DUF3473 domain-containing protein [Candidatus Polarisedimenticolaceae bacterium]|nr:DUF3473 domain-containing protein [Candidatus Polarisedimenticolaceae bacterium]